MASNDMRSLDPSVVSGAHSVVCRSSLDQPFGNMIGQMEAKAVQIKLRMGSSLESGLASILESSGDGSLNNEDRDMAIMNM